MLSALSSILSASVDTDGAASASEGAGVATSDLSSLAATNIATNYPLHWKVWNNDISSLKTLFQDEAHKPDVEKKDPRNRTALQLAIMLGHIDCAKFLLTQNASVNLEDKHGFNVLHEAVSLADPTLIRDVLEKRDLQRYSSRIDGIPSLLRKIRDTPDFYVEMKWEFTSWIPLLSRMCPSDTYKIYKSGSNVRVDTTLVGFDQAHNWERGSRSYIFKGHEAGATFYEVDHDASQVHVDSMKVIPTERMDSLAVCKPSQDAIDTRLSNPTTITFVDTDRILFERSKSGIIGFRSEKSENVCGYECKVFTANNVEVITRVRMEHLTETDKTRYKNASASRLTPFQQLLGLIQIEENSPYLKNSTSEHDQITNPTHITWQEYFDPDLNLSDRDIGRPKEITTKIQRFRANLWLCEDYPLSLQEQVLPIVDLMAISSSHFKKLRDFITLTLPAGFPVKIEIPLFHVLNARITFGNIFSLENSVPGVTSIRDDATTACVVDEYVFQPPPHYSTLGSDDLRTRNRDDSELMEMAMQHYLVQEDGTSEQITINDFLALRNQPDMDENFQRAIQESLEEYQRSLSRQNNPSIEGAEGGEEAVESTGTSLETADTQPESSKPYSNGNIPNQQSEQADTPLIDLQGSDAQQLEIALRLSRQESLLSEEARKREEEELNKVLQLSLTEK